MRAIIVDDEENAQLALKKTLSLFCPEIEVVSSFFTLEDTLAFLNGSDESIGLMFLDIQLGDKQSVDQLKVFGVDKFPPIIFTTAYEQFAIEAIKLQALDYLLKPVSPEELVAAVDRIKTASKPTKEPIRKISFAQGNTMVFLEEADIFSLEADGSYCRVYLDAGEVMTISKPLSRVFDQLSDDFCRAHRTWAINFQKIESYSKSDGGVVTLKNGQKIHLGKSHKNEVEERLKHSAKSV